MSNREIVQKIATRREVERIVNSTCGKAESDLSQMIYELLMAMPNARLAQLNDSGQLGYYIMGVARRQYYRSKSRYHADYRRKPDARRLCDNG